MNDTITCDRCDNEAAVTTTDALPDGWAVRRVEDPLWGTDLVRAWDVVLCPECVEREEQTGESD